MGLVLSAKNDFKGKQVKYTLDPFTRENGPSSRVSGFAGGIREAGPGGHQQHHLQTADP